ncbi:MAG TPA: hypothetical protein VMN78_00610 [Longimicrobiales bacterium]|nr:hypothetical protein [Longimicrobiales bacterium]
MTKWNAVPVALALGFFAASPAEAQVGFGVQGSWGDDSDLGVGARVVAPVGHMITADGGSVLAGLKAIGSFDWFFIDCPDGVDCSWIEINANGAVPLPLEGFSPYVGAGLNIARISFESEEQGVPGAFDVSDTEVGLNLLGGLDFPLGGLNAFAEGRFELGGGEQFVVTVGVLF